MARWNLPDDLSAAEKRKLRKELRKKLETEGPDAVAEYLVDDDEAKPSKAKASKKAKGADGGDDGDDEADEEDEEASSRRKRKRRRAAKVNVASNGASGPADFDALRTSLIAAGIDFQADLTHGYAFQPFGDTTAELLIEKFTARHGYPPKVFNFFAGNLVAFGPIAKLST